MTDNNTILHCHFDGDFLDTSKNENSITKNGDVTFDFATFGDGAKFNGGYLTLADAAYWTLQDFTIDFRLKFTTVQDCIFLIHRQSSNQYWIFHLYQGSLVFQVYNGGALINFNTPWSPTAGINYHIELARDGNNFYLFVDGVKISTIYTNTAAIPDFAGNLTIGANSFGGVSSLLYGVIDELRISDIARHTENFTPETTAHEDYQAPPPPPPPEPVDLGDVKNVFYADKAALLDPDCQFYTRAYFSLTVPAGETWYVFNAWRLGINGSPFHFYHRTIGIDDALALSEGTVITGLDPHSIFWYARPLLVQDDARYQDAESLYFERLAKIRSCETKALIVGRAGNTLAGGDARFPSSVSKAIVTQTFTHGGCFTLLDGGAGGAGNKERVTNVDTEINDGYEFRIGNTCLQPFNTSVFDGVFLGAGNPDNNRSVGPNNTYTGPVPHFEKTSGGVLYVELPDGF